MYPYPPPSHRHQEISRSLQTAPKVSGSLRKSPKVSESPTVECETTQSDHGTSSQSQEFVLARNQSYKPNHTISERSSPWTFLHRRTPPQSIFARPRSLSSQDPRLKWGPCLRLRQDPTPASWPHIFEQELVKVVHWTCPNLPCCSLTAFCNLALPLCSGLTFRKCVPTEGYQSQLKATSPC